ncbi:hypothetical protein [Gilvimarinus xylanilyticus]|uniref:Surface antigen domain-containing protein n=1 Tax=Gilvimarinus xylanilyticus TaxID=2944139 RepID=A0A9X2I7L6_9GAMM|nr:hypothetical protein [Gilvimarinus xylanilyticus]MCP8900922.1 hypothetical protein [Gilvimarinus xylanilyticus]
MRYPAYALLTAALLASGPSHSANLQFMGRSVASEMSAEEVADFKTSIAEALNEAPDLRTIAWQSDNSSRRGRVKIKYSYENNGRECRKAILDLRNDQNRRDFFHFDACRTSEGRWQVSETAAADFTPQEWNMLKSVFVDAIENNQDGEPAQWQRQEHSATLTPLSTSQSETKTCRLMKIELASGPESKAEGVYNFCKEDYTWQRQAP